MTLRLTTELGVINLALRPDIAPLTVAHLTKLISHNLFDGTSFYRSDFVIQCGLHGSGKANPFPALSVNESGKVSNTRGTASVAHWDVPDCGNSEFFINLSNNAHLDAAYVSARACARAPQRASAPQRARRPSSAPLRLRLSRRAATRCLLPLGRATLLRGWPWTPSPRRSRAGKRAWAWCARSSCSGGEPIKRPLLLFALALESITPPPPATPGPRRRQ